VVTAADPTARERKNRVSTACRDAVWHILQAVSLFVHNYFVNISQIKVPTSPLLAQASQVARKFAIIEI